MENKIQKLAYDILAGYIPTTKEKIRKLIKLDDDLTKDSKIDTDSLSEWIQNLTQELDVDIPNSEWLKVYNIRQVVKMLEKYIDTKSDIRGK